MRITKFHLRRSQVRKWWKGGLNQTLIYGTLTPFHHSLPIFFAPYQLSSKKNCYYIEKIFQGICHPLNLAPKLRHSLRYWVFHDTVLRHRVFVAQPFETAWWHHFEGPKVHAVFEKPNQTKTKQRTPLYLFDSLKSRTQRWFALSEESS